MELTVFEKRLAVKLETMHSPFWGKKTAAKLAAEFHVSVERLEELRLAELKRRKKIYG